MEKDNVMKNSQCPQCKEVGTASGIHTLKAEGEVTEEQVWRCNGCDRHWFTPVTHDKCSLCDVDFDIENEGGIKGDIGMMPFSLCILCMNAMCEMAENLSGCTCDAAREVVENQETHEILTREMFSVTSNLLQTALQRLQRAVKGEDEPCDSTKH